MSKQDWWQDFFEKFYYNSHIMDPEFTVSDNLDILIELLNINNKGTYLDLAGGKGRHSAILSPHGKKFIVLDISKTALESGREYIKEKGIGNISFIESDMRSFSLRDKVDGIFCLYSSFGYFDTEQEDLAVLKRAYEALNSRGKLLLQHFNIDWTLNNFNPERIINESNPKLVSHRDYDPETRFLTSVITENDEKKHRMRIRSYTPNEMRAVLAEAGFGNVNIYDLKGGRNIENSPTLFYVAEKNEC